MNHTTRVNSDVSVQITIEHLEITSGEILFINVICTNNIIFKLHLSGYQWFIARTTVEALYLYQF